MVVMRLRNNALRTLKLIISSFITLFLLCNLTAASPNGQNVTGVTVENGGKFVQLADGWVELRSDGSTAFYFTEVDRDNWSVYLRDASRDVNLQIDLNTKWVKYASGRDEFTNLYRIIAAKAPKSKTPQESQKVQESPANDGSDRQDHWSANVTDEGAAMSDCTGQNCNENILVLISCTAGQDKYQMHVMALEQRNESLAGKHTTLMVRAGGDMVSFKATYSSPGEAGPYPVAIFSRDNPLFDVLSHARSADFAIKNANQTIQLSGFSSSLKLMDKHC